MKMHGSSAPRRTLGDLGATLAEYALIFTFLAVLAIGGTKALGNIGKNEVANEANCVSKRPPPASCQFKPAVTTTTASTVPTTATTVPPPPPNLTYTGPTGVKLPAAVPGGGYGAQVTITIKRSGAAQANVKVTYVFDYTTSSGCTVSCSDTQTCTTNAAGTCTVTQYARYSDTTAIKVTTTDVVDTSPGTLPSPITV